MNAVINPIYAFGYIFFIGFCFYFSFSFYFARLKKYFAENRNAL